MFLFCCQQLNWVVNNFTNYIIVLTWNYIILCYLTMYINNNKK